MEQVVSIAEMRIVVGQGGIVTHALGSCLGLTVWDSQNHVGGLLHAMLPLSRLNPEKAAARPYMFVDVGVPGFLAAFFEAGGRPESMVLKAAGCAMPMGAMDAFRIGERNHSVLLKILEKNDLRLAAADIGGTKGRTLRLDVATGCVSVRSAGEETEL